jgi:hypothetical protein
MPSISLESLLDLINNQQKVKDVMAKEAAEIVYDTTQTMKGVNTSPPSHARQIVEAESLRLSKPNDVIETSVARTMIQLSAEQQYPYGEDDILEEELFNSISHGLNEVALPKKIIVERKKYLRDRPTANGSWFSDEQSLNDMGYDKDYGGLHTVNYVLARLNGFHKLDRPPKSRQGRLQYSSGRDILLSALFLAIAEVQENNKKILDRSLKNG